MRAKLPVALLVLAIGACDCGSDPGLGRVVPLIEVEEGVDFGQVPLRATKRMTLTVRNGGGATLTIASVDTTAPFAARLLDTEIPAGGTGRIEVAFTPPGQEPQSQTLVINSDGDNNPMATVSLTGLGIAGFIGVEPRQVDFVDTTVGANRSVELAVTNSGIEIVSGAIRTEAFERDNHYALTGVAPFGGGGTYSIGPRGTLVVDLEYSPAMAGADHGRIVFETCGERCGVEVEVRATAVEAALRLEPASIDFGASGIGQSRGETVTVLNDGNEAVDITSVEVRGGGFSVNPPVSTPMTISPQSTAVINVEFLPASAGDFEADLLIGTTDRALPLGVVRLVGEGQGPLFEVEPAAIDFVERTTGTFRRSFIMRNGGSAEVEVRAVTVTGATELALVDLPGLPTRLGGGESIIAGVLYSPTAEGLHEGTLVIETDDAAAMSVTVPIRAGYEEASCLLEVEPAQLNFGLVPPRYTRDRVINVVNAGGQMCTITAGAFETPVDAAFAIGVEPWPLTLAPQQSQALTFRFQPVEERPSKSKYILQTDDMVFNRHPIGLVGSSEAYNDLFALPPFIDFGQIRPGCSAGGRKVTLFNAGTLPVDVDRVSITSMSTEFSGARGAVTIGPGDSHEFTVDYTPTDLGIDTGELEIAVHAQPYALITPMQGEGTSVPLLRDVFTQSEKQEVDVLFVVDDSCSMADEQHQLGQNFSSFISTANVRQVDFQIGVTTTDVSFGPQGDLVGPIITRSTPNFERAFQQQAVRGVGGSGFEQGLEAMNRALEKAAAGTAPNAGLLRRGAAFVLIIISDEDDQSPAADVFYFNRLRQFAGNGFSVAVVSGQTNGCASNLGSATPGAKYESFVALTGGISESICSNNWAQTLGNIGAAVFGLKDRFQLSSRADQSQPIVVTVDGVAAAPSHWSYDAADQSIVFDRNFLPPERAQISIEYTPQC